MNSIYLYKIAYNLINFYFHIARKGKNLWKYLNNGKK